MVVAENNPGYSLFQVDSVPLRLNFRHGGPNVLSHDADVFPPSQIDAIDQNRCRVKSPCRF
jgi:hypothetical protein